MGEIKRRLDKLESWQGGCTECGWDQPDLEIEVVWDDSWGDESEEREPEFCPRCGRPDEVIITWGDSPAEEDELARLRHEAAQRRLRERNPNEF